MYIGVMNLIIIASILAKHNLKNILLSLPILFYNFGTMLLLTDNWDVARYYYYTFLITPIVLITIFKNDNLN